MEGAAFAEPQFKEHMNRQETPKQRLQGAAYRQFRTLACEAYNILRHSAGLLLSLLHLMAGAAVADLATDPSKALLKLQVGPWLEATARHKVRSIPTVDF